MALTPEQRRQRDGRLTASAVGALMSGDPGKIFNLWRLMVGDPDYVEPDLSAVWAVRLGEATEALNLDWYEQKTGRPVTRRGEVVICPRADWAAATLDGWDDAIPAPIECKHVGGREPRERIVARYTPQCVWQMIVTGARCVMLSIIEAANAPVIETVAWHEEYAAEMWRRAEAFMRHVWDLTPPIAMAPVAAPIAAIKTYDMASSNSWCEHATHWLANRGAAKRFEAAAAELKALVPADAARAHGAGIVVSRAKNGALSIREEQK